MVHGGGNFYPNREVREAAMRFVEEGGGARGRLLAWLRDLDIS